MVLYKVALQYKLVVFPDFLHLDVWVMFGGLFCILMLGVCVVVEIDLTNLD